MIKSIDLWLATKIICLDGAVGRLKSYSEKSKSFQFKRGPDYVIGDFDSIDPDSLKWLNDKVCNLNLFITY